MNLVSNWKSAYKWFSVHCMAGSATVLAAWGSIPDDLKQHVPDSYIRIFTIGLLITGIAGRLINQDAK